jgi:hypothetical protein
MAQGELTKKEAKAVLEILNEMFEAIPKSKRMNYIGHLNDVCLFVEAVGRSAPEK